MVNDDLVSRAALLKECEERQKSNPMEDGRGWADHFLNAGMEPSTEWNSVEEMIEYAPAVDAIPVEWLIDRANDPKRAPLYRRYAQMLYEEWQKEQEANNGRT